MELVQIHVVALPGNGLAIRGEDDAGDVALDELLGVVAGDPGGLGERERTGSHRQINLSVKQLPRCIGEVGCNLDRVRLRIAESRDKKEGKPQYTRGTGTTGHSRRPRREVGILRKCTAGELA